MNNKIKQIKNDLLLDEENLLNLWNEYAATDRAGCEGFIYPSIEDLAEAHSSEDLATFASRVYFGAVESWVDPYWVINDAGNFESFSRLLDPKSPIDLDELVAWIAEREE